MNFNHNETMYLLTTKTPTLSEEREKHMAYKLQEIVHKHTSKGNIVAFGVINCRQISRGADKTWL